MLALAAKFNNYDLQSATGSQAKNWWTSFAKSTHEVTVQGKIGNIKLHCKNVDNQYVVFFLRFIVLSIYFGNSLDYNCKLADI
jgi:hypothetical protein